MAQIEAMLPRWTKRVFTETGGRDPLGLSRVANSITDFLLTGIITTTDRARYYSFYCWALWHIQKEERPTKHADFVDAFRRREAAFALATLADNPEASMVGIQAVKPQFHHGRAQGFFDCNFQVLPSNKLGGYGQNYEGSLHELGLTHPGEDGIDRPRKGVAEELAISFHEAVQQTPYIKKHLFTSTNIDVRDLDGSKERFTLDALTRPFANTERLKLTELFFGLTDSSPSPRTILRRQTLTLNLHLIAEYERYEQPINLENDDGSVSFVNRIDWQLVFAPYYYGVLSASPSNCISYQAPPGFDFCLSLWKQFCIHQFLTRALEEFLYSVLEVISSAASPPTVNDVIDSLQTELSSLLLQMTGKSCPTPSELFLACEISQVPDQEVSESLQRHFSLHSSLNEAQALQLKEKTPTAAVARAFLLLVMLYGKWRGIKTDSGLTYLTSYISGQWWIGSVLPLCDSWLSKDQTWESVLRVLIENILTQHDKVMYEKGRLDSCWIHRVDHRFFKDQDYAPTWRSSRHKNVVSILRDLDLLTNTDTGHLLLTSTGKQLLQMLLRDDYGQEITNSPQHP